MGDAYVTTQEDRGAVTPSLAEDGPRSAAPAGSAGSSGSTRTWTSRARLGSPRAPRRPRLWFEILLIAVSYWLYSLVRNAVPEQKAAALRNADRVWSLEHTLGLAFEQSVNHAVNSVTWLIVAMNYYYATLHFVITIAVLVWLFRRQPGRYGAARLVLFATTAVALLGYYLFPLAPPRLMHGGSFIDTVLLHETWGSMASGNFKQMSNQYAAMPSMHIGWSLWCGLTVFALARAPWARVLGLLYPTVTLVVIVATANHFWLDAVGGMVCLAFGYAVSYVWYGSLPHRLPRTVPARRRPGRPRVPHRLWGRVAPRRRPGPSAPAASRPVAPRRPEPDPAAAVPPTPPGA
ncbi:phosphatase PAP2 family protein [Streptomyces halstedii]|uniref:phosphatase PAP2 family protein n=1 Tax=Streptomyces halstedii TaxID=1944 RepID=UPI0037BA6B45